MKRCPHNDAEPCAHCLETREALRRVRHQRRVERLAAAPSQVIDNAALRRLHNRDLHIEPGPTLELAPPAELADRRSYRPPLTPPPAPVDNDDLFDGRTVALMLAAVAAFVAVAFVASLYL